MASRGVNKVILVGNLGADPEVRYGQNQTAMLNMTVATSESWKDKNTGEQREHTEWHRIVAYRRLAEIIGQYAKKGSKVYVEGKLKTRKWQNQQGQDQYTTEIVAHDIQILDSRSSGQNQAPGYGANTSDQNQAGRSHPAPGGGAGHNNSAPQNAAGKPLAPDHEFEDEIPF